jgi:hypothetical protein
VRLAAQLTALLVLVAAAGCGDQDVERALSRPSPVQEAAALGAIAEAPAPPVVTARSAVRAGAAEAARRYERNDRARVPRTGVAPFLPLYRLAARHYEIPWRLLAAIHKQETAFSTAEGTYHGLNFAGCCAGPMQFNLKNKPVSTWKRFGNAYKIGPPRPAGYPNRTERHPSPYDDWDAIIAAARLLAANGAGAELDGAAWTAAYLYYGPGDLTEDDYGVTYANEVIARALNWERRGFCPGCSTPGGLVRAVHAKFAPPLKDAAKEARKKRGREAARRRRARKRRERERRERAERRAGRRRAAGREARRRREDRERARQPSAAREEDRKDRSPAGGPPATRPPAEDRPQPPPAQTQPPAQTTPPAPITPQLPSVEREAASTQPPAPVPAPGP